ncbi:hypothetical protein F0562_025525 [Nyssa sinensis]|uniref:Uncharacterized protein n=1 Tax=Nyssa sinensis TaxID=561372 RepID=A0A5J5B6F9_9ASTE|nr:hypothetical protein F0562_025525 [Nyssa sinensis]
MAQSTHQSLPYSYFSDALGITHLDGAFRDFTNSGFRNCTKETPTFCSSALEFCDGEDICPKLSCWSFPSIPSGIHC